MEIFLQLGIALAIGLLIGAERGWQQRQAREGSRIAGIRTFGLIGLFGGIWGILAKDLGEILLGFSFLALSALLITAYYMDSKVDQDVGITTIVAGMITFSLGGLSVHGYLTIAAAGAVVITTLLSMKAVLHNWLQHIAPKEFYATLKLLLISVVILPVLPNDGFGPWGVLNPYKLWWMVVLIASISFAGYVAVKVAGTRLGIMLTGFFGGLASSTAVTLNFAEFAKKQTLKKILMAGVLIASATMFPRVLLEIAIINNDLLLPILTPLLVMTIITFISAFWFWRQKGTQIDGNELPLDNPFQLKTALKFGLLLAFVMIFSEAFRVWLGDTGIYIMSAISGFADVDAITLSLSSMSRSSITSEVAVNGIVLATMVNTFIKGLLFSFVIRKAWSLKLILAFSLVVFSGALTLIFQ